MARVHVCSHIEPDGTSCPELTPCPRHSRPRNARWSKNRDGAQHMREARAAKRAQPYCTHCGTTQKLDYHHTGPGVGVVLCNACHASVDTHARAR